jgi:dCTP deaminase
MILTDHKIQKAIDDGGIFIDPFDPKQLQPATYDMRVGAEAVTSSSKELRKLDEKGFITFQPGDFGFIITMEKIKLSPNYAARFGLRSSLARKGLSATTGPQIDPGYQGRLILGISNLTPNPVTLSHGEDLVSIEFHELPGPAKHPYDGPFQGVEHLRPEEISAVTEKKGMLLSEMQETLSSLSANVGRLTDEFSTFKLWIGASIALLGILVAVVAIIK